MLQKQLEIFDQVEAKKSAEVPMFKEIADSQRAFAARAVKWDLDTNVSRRMAYNHYFAKTASLKRASFPSSFPVRPAVWHMPDGWPVF